MVRPGADDEVIGVTLIGARGLLNRDGGLAITLPGAAVKPDPEAIAAAIAEPG